MEGETKVIELQGELMELLVKSAPELYSKYTIDEKGKTVLYVELLKHIYSCLIYILLVSTEN